MLLKMKCGRKLLLELNVEPSFNNQQEEAFVEINEVNDVLLSDPGKVSVDNECLFQKKTNGVDVLAAIYTWARVRGRTADYTLMEFNCDHLVTLFMTGRSEWTTFTSISGLGRLTNRFNFEGEISKIGMENIHKKM